MAPREIGVAHADGVNAFFGLDINEFYPFLVKEGTPNRTPDELEREMDEMRLIHETRLFVVLAAGSFDFIARYRKGIRPQLGLSRAQTNRRSIASASPRPIAVGPRNGQG